MSSCASRARRSRACSRPTIFFLGLTAVFGNLTLLPGFDDRRRTMSFLIPVSLLQGAGFTGAATGVNLARDIEQGWFDRLLVSPAPRRVLLAGHGALGEPARADPRDAAARRRLRARRPASPGLDGLLIAIFFVMGMAAVAALWGSTIALKFKSQSAAPLMQAGMLVLILTTTAYAPLELLTGWLQDIARYNPVTQIVEAVRQGFVGKVTWADTWPGLICLAGLLALFGALALRGMSKTSD